MLVHGRIILYALHIYTLFYFDKVLIKYHKHAIHLFVICVCNRKASLLAKIKIQNQTNIEQNRK